jgi:hypothetical protein
LVTTGPGGTNAVTLDHGQERACPAERDCDEPHVYQRSGHVPVHRHIRIDPQGYGILVGDASESEIDHYGFSPAGSLWIAKTRTPVTSLIE